MFIIQYLDVNLFKQRAAELSLRTQQFSDENAGKLEHTDLSSEQCWSLKDVYVQPHL